MFPGVSGGARGSPELPAISVSPRRPARSRAPLHAGAITRRMLLGAPAAVAAGPATAVGGSPAAAYAIYAEYARDANQLMQPRLNRRVFNVVEVQAGSAIRLNDDGSITLQPGAYRITGFSITTMQVTFAPPRPRHDTNYPGYALVYRVADEAHGAALASEAIAIGSPQTALDTTPSLFDTVYTTAASTDIAVGHQSGAELHDEVYLSVYEVDGTPSDFHVFARISITTL